MAAPAEGQEGAERVELRFPAAPREGSSLASIVELVAVIAVALGLTWLTQQYVVKSYRIPTGSMRTTVDEGDRVLAARFLGWFTDPERGDVIVFNPPGVGDVAQRNSPTKARVTFIKRVVGLPGETVQGWDNRVLICRAPRVACHVLHEPYASGVTSDFGPITVPRDAYLVLGDNRQSSEDSRVWGTLPKDNIIGTAFVRYWPPRRFGIL
ncbi:MAG: signal peptidase [Gaiellales bacterium]|jgi:signal peptidase I|nr:signal peptidase [Gaiellales bacterium]MDX6596885.1 signal peptidase [Gaiellales bacterium]